MNQEIIDKWVELRNDIIYNNRYFCKNPLLKQVENIVNKRNEYIGKGTNVYRARITDIMNIGNCFKSPYFAQLHEKIKDLPNSEQIRLRSEALDKYNVLGYDEENSSAPPAEKTQDGRANPKYIPYLYVALKPYTALVECKPYLEEYISVATFKTKDQLKICNFYIKPEEFNINDNSPDGELLNRLNFLFGHPIRNGEKEYIFSQFIAEFVKSHNYDGISYNSSLHKNGVNITFFDKDCCEFVRSDIYFINDIMFSAKKYYKISKDIIYD